MEDLSPKHSAHAVQETPLFEGGGIDHVGIRYDDLNDEPPRHPHHIALRVPDTAAAEAALRTAGIALHRFGPNWGFQDPEGNVFHFMPSR